MEKFARQCSETGKGMNEGWVIGDGEDYVSTKEGALKWANKMGYSTIEEAYDDDAMYWTSWYDDEDEWEYIMIGDLLFKIDSEKCKNVCAMIWLNRENIPNGYIDERVYVIVNGTWLKLSKSEIDLRAKLCLYYYSKEDVKNLQGIIDNF